MMTQTSLIDLPVSEEFSRIAVLFKPYLEYKGKKSNPYKVDGLVKLYGQQIKDIADNVGDVEFAWRLNGFVSSKYWQDRKVPLKAFFKIHEKFKSNKIEAKLQSTTPVLFEPDRATLKTTVMGTIEYLIESKILGDRTSRVIEIRDSIKPRDTSIDAIKEADKEIKEMYAEFYRHSKGGTSA